MKTKAKAAEELTLAAQVVENLLTADALGDEAFRFFCGNEVATYTDALQLAEDLADALRRLAEKLSPEVTQDTMRAQAGH